MNKNLNLVEILKNCPKGTKLYSLIFGEVEFERIDNGCGTITYKTNTGRNFDVSYEGKFFTNYDGECVLFPSKEQRDWSKFTAPWYKKERFDPNTLKPFDKVLVKRAGKEDSWTCNIFSSYSEGTGYDFECLDDVYEICVPYNDDTKHLVGTKEEVPEYYRYWED